MTVLDGILQGIIQGLTEFLPVSSDGHLSIYQHFTGNAGEGALVFTLMLHIGTLLAVFVYYRKMIWNLILEFFALLSDLFHGRLFKEKANENRMMIYMVVLATLPLLAFVLIKDFIIGFAEDTDIIVEGLCFLFTASMLYFSSKAVKGKRSAKNMKPVGAITIGFFQGLAIMPGISRSGSTISTGLLMGFSKEFMVKFSFILSIPAILGASILDLKDVLQTGANFGMLPVVAGMITAAIVGFFAIKLIEYLVINDKFIIFAYYTFFVGIAVLILGIAEKFGFSLVM